MGTDFLPVVLCQDFVGSFDMIRCDRVDAQVIAFSIKVVIFLIEFLWGSCVNPNYDNPPFFMHLFDHFGVDRIYLQVTADTHILGHFFNWRPGHIIIEVLEVKWM